MTLDNQGDLMHLQFSSSKNKTAVARIVCNCDAAAAIAVKAKQLCHKQIRMEVNSMP